MKIRLVAPMATACRSEDTLLKPARGENVVEVIEDRVDAGELVEHADGDGQENREAVFPGEERVDSYSCSSVQWRRQFPEFRFVIFLAGDAEDVAGFFDTFLVFSTSQRGLRGMVKSSRKKSKAGVAAMPNFQRHSAPPRVEFADEVIREVGEEDSENDVELKKADQAAAPFCGSHFGDVHGAEDGRAADAQAADEAKDYERGPVPGDGAA